MRRTNVQQGGMLSCVSLKSRAPVTHPPRAVRAPLGYNLLFGWFVGLAVDEPIWDHSTLTRNRKPMTDILMTALPLRFSTAC